MQKKLIALAIAAAASGAAFAQTNVQIYGIADVGYVGIDRDNFKYQNNINSGVLSTSRIGFKGAEDLGNGLKAIFTLEYGLLLDQNTDIGASGGNAADARQQFVGLTGGFGTVVAGRLQTAGLDFTVAGSALGGAPAIGAVNLVGQAGNNGVIGNVVDGVGGPFPLLNATSRANNAVAYISPSFGGLTLAVNHGRVSEAAAATDEKDSSATLLAANYENGGLSAGVVYGKIDLEQGTVNNGDSTEWGVRAGYDFGFAKLQAAYQQAKLKEASLFGIGETAKNKRFVVSATVPVTAKIAIIGEYAQAKIDQGAGNSDNKDKAFTLASTYSLSKRTTAYAAFARQTFNNNDDKDTVFRNKTNYYGVGLRHAF